MLTLSEENILSQEEIENLFTDEDNNNNPNNEPPQEEEKPEGGEEEGKEKNKKTTEVNPETLFEEEEKPESVGSEENNKGGEGSEPQGEGASPELFSSIALALKGSGVFTDLEEDELKEIKTPEDLKDAMQKQVDSMFNEQQKRVNEALNVGVEPDAIRRFEGILGQLRSVKEEELTANTKEGENLRRQILMLDFTQQGMSAERAKKLVDRTFAGGSDIADAKEALQDSITKIQEKYDSLINEAKEAQKREQEQLRQEAQKLKDSILNDKEMFSDFEVDKATRKKIYDTISVPSYKDPETGELLTEIQKFEREHRVEFLKFAGLFYVLTNGFKDTKNIVKKKVTKESNKVWKEVERTLNNSRRNNDGSLNFGSSKGDTNSFSLGEGWGLNI